MCTKDAAQQKVAFVSGLWGDEIVRRVPKVLDDIHTMLKRPIQPEPRVAYCYGRQHFDFVKNLGLETRLASEAPLEKFSEAEERNPNDRGNVNYGVSMWRHKLEIMHLAAQEFDALVWLDWDSWLHYPLPADFWERLAQGAEIQASLRQYKRRQCRWRSTDIRKVPSAAWVYLRGSDITARMLELHTEMPHLREEQIMAYVTDQMSGGWQSPETYKNNGFEPYCFRVRGQIHRPEIRLFDAR